MSERRAADRMRISASDGPEASLQFRSPEQRSVRLLDLSLTGCGFVLDDVGNINPGEMRMMTLGLSSRHAETSPIVPVHMELMRGGISAALRAGVQFADARRGFTEGLCRFIVSARQQTPNMPHFFKDISSFEEVANAKSIRLLLSYLAQRGIALRIFDSRQVYRGDVRINGVSRGTLAMTFKPAQRRRLSRELYYFTVCSLNTLYVFSAVFLRTTSSGGQRESHFEIPQVMLLGGFRATGRACVPAGSELRLEYMHPVINGHFVSKQPLEISISGLSFELALAHDLLVPGMTIESALIRLPRQRSITCSFEVRHIFSEGLQRHLCGVSLTPRTESGLHNWIDFVLTHLAPRVSRVEPWNLGSVWKIFDQAGYLAEKPIEQMGPMEDAFVDVWGELLRNRGHSRCWVYSSQTEPIGTVCLSQIYERTWIAHQFAADLDRFDDPLRKLQVPFELVPKVMMTWVVGIAGPTGNMVTYYDPHKAFNKWAWFEFFQRHDRRGHCQMDLLRLFDFRVETLEPQQREHEIWVREATAEERERVSQQLLETEGTLVQSALDLTAKKIDLGNCQQGIDGAIIARHRAIFIAGQGETMIGFGLAESAKAGVNIFALYNSVRIQLCLASPLGERCRDALFWQIVDHYRALGATNFLYLRGTDDQSPPARATACHEQDLMRIVHTGELMAEWMGYMTNLWGHY